MQGRIQREQCTVKVMTRMYCRDNHAGAAESAAGSGLCSDCAALLEYALRRVDRCRFGEQKPTCARCAVHCFQVDKRERIRAVMRYSGPRMTLRHPYLAVRHILDRRGTPEE